MLKNTIASALIGALVALSVGSLFGSGASFGGSIETVKVRLGKGFDSFATSTVQGNFVVTGGISQAGTNATTTVQTFTQGGGVNATSTTQATVLTAADFDTENVIDITWTEAVAGGNITLPASSTLSSFVPTAGMMRTVWIRNATTTAATRLTIVGNTGTLLKVASSSATNLPIIGGDTDGGNHGRLDFLRKANTDIEVFLTVFND